MDARRLLTDLFDAAVAAAHPRNCMAGHLPRPPHGRTAVFAYGKAAAAMAAEVEARWSGPLEGIAVVPAGHEVPLQHIRLIVAGHPHPDGQSAVAARAMLDLAASLGADDLALCLVSGGGSALLSLPRAGLSVAAKDAVLRALHRSGAPIADINAVRRRLSAIKGGRLAAAAAPARVHSIVISDVPGDDPALVASGPSFAVDTDVRARPILDRWRIDVADDVAALLADDEGALPEFDHSFRVAATARVALEAAAVVACARGIAVIVGSDQVEGEARVVGARDAAMARAQVTAGRPLLLLSGGETTVTLRGKGRGGRNTEYLAAFAAGIDGLPVAALAADTDGIDGSEGNAGAFADGTTVSRARALGYDIDAILADNDAYSLFAALGDLIVTGPTRTNVNDFRAILIGAA